MGDQLGGPEYALLVPGHGATNPLGEVRAGGSAGGAKRRPPALADRSLSLALKDAQCYSGSARGVRLARRSSASNSRCTTSSLRIRSSRA
jgi:hypothetical protein